MALAPSVRVRGYLAVLQSPIYLKGDVFMLGFVNSSIQSPIEERCQAPEMYPECVSPGFVGAVLPAAVALVPYVALPCPIQCVSTTEPRTYFYDHSGHWMHHQSTTQLTVSIR